jgi:hypothetical protein
MYPHCKNYVKMIFLQLICLMFDLGGSKAHRRTQAFRALKRRLTHDLIYEILGPVRAAQEEGGFYMQNHEGTMVRAYPAVCLVISDTPERQALAQIYGHVQGKTPCYGCE